MPLLIYFLFLLTLPLNLLSLSYEEVVNCGELINFGYDCPGPLSRGSWGLGLRGGVAPTYWNDPQLAYEVNPLIFPFVIPLNSQGDSFDKEFNTPWTVGLEAHYNFSEKIQCFASFDYLQGSGRSHSLSSPSGLLLQEKFHSYKALEAYLGVRKYFAAWFWGLTPFIGVKAGLRYNFAIRAKVEAAGFSRGEGYYFHDVFCFATGIQLGFDYPITSCVSLTLLLEGIFTAPMRTGRLELALPDGGQAIIAGNTGTQISAPLTLGVKWYY